MGWAFGLNSVGREIGYGVEAVCDLPGCSSEIDRGLAYCCGGIEGVDNGGMEDEAYCGDYFCAAHLRFVPGLGGEGGMWVCENCYKKATCPDCCGAGANEEGELCKTCDSHGVVTQTYVAGRGVVPVTRER